MSPKSDGFWVADTEVTDDNLNAATLQYGVAASRPTAASGNKGMVYFSTDTPIMERSNGSTWDEVHATDHASLGSFRTLGTGSTQAAAGDHTH